MNYVVAGVVSVLAFAATTIFWSFAPIYQVKVNAGSDDSPAPAPASTSLSNLKNIPKNVWAVFVLLALLCGMAAWGVWNGGATSLSFIRYILALLFLVSAAAFDYRTHLIPNFLIIIILISGAIVLGVIFLLDRSAFAAAILSAGGGIVFCFPVFYLLSRLTRGGLGMGDVKLIAAMAWLLGLTVTLFSVLFGLVLCALIAIVLMLTKTKKKTDFIPFGPFVFGGYLLMLIFFRV